MTKKFEFLAVYRVGDGRHPLFDGRGAALHGGRWNSEGRFFIYCALSQSGAMLESLARANIGKLPDSFQLVTASVPAHSVEEVAAGDLPGWNQPESAVAIDFGNNWYDSRRSLALIVPSVVAEHDRNIIINQLHPDFPLIKIDRPKTIQWDKRFLQAKEVHKKKRRK